MIVPSNWVRLACVQCDRDDYDGISEQVLDVLRGSWEDVALVQSYEDAIRVYPDPSLEPPGYSVFDWWTHIGLCPDCQRISEAADHDQRTLLL